MSFQTRVPLHSWQLLTSFSGLWKCLTMPLTASPIASCIWPVFSSAKYKNISNHFRNTLKLEPVHDGYVHITKQKRYMNQPNENVLAYWQWKSNSTFIYRGGRWNGDLDVFFFFNIKIITVVFEHNNRWKWYLCIIWIFRPKAQSWKMEMIFHYDHRHLGNTFCDSFLQIQVCLGAK